MSTRLYVMERAGERMNVPPEKKQAFLDDGWKVVQEPDVIAAAEPAGEMPVTEEAQAEVEKPAKGKRHK